MDIRTQPWFNLLYCWLFHFLIPCESAWSKSQHFNDLDFYKKAFIDRAQINSFCLFLILMILAARGRLAATLENCWICVSPSEQSQTPGNFFFFLLFLDRFLSNVSYAHNDLYRLAMLWTSGTHFLCRRAEFITGITTTIDQTNNILDEILIFQYVVLMWSYQCYCLDLYMII